jgi:predicted nucleotidyltransferase
MAKRYKTYDEIRSSRIAERRVQALAALDHAQEIAVASGCRLIVFGSLVEGGFHEASDIDVAVFGEPTSSDVDAAAEVDTALRLAGFSADVIPERFLPPSLRKRILDHGREPSALGGRQT